MILVYFLIAFLAFCTGWLFSENKIKKAEKPRKKGDFGADEKLRREYENFLNYDGSEQS